jgi:Sec-independent protein translocase protein TatA
MLGVGSSELLLILLIAAIVIGPNNVRPLIKAFIKGLRTFKKYIEEMKSELDIPEDIDDVTREIKDTAADLSLKDEMEEVISEASALKKELLADKRAKKNQV